MMNKVVTLLAFLASVLALMEAIHRLLEGGDAIWPALTALWASVAGYYINYNFKRLYRYEDQEFKGCD